MQFDLLCKPIHNRQMTFVDVMSLHQFERKKDRLVSDKVTSGPPNSIGGYGPQQGLCDYAGRSPTEKPKRKKGGNKETSLGLML